jgi:hypothetical protein
MEARTALSRKRVGKRMVADIYPSSPPMVGAWLISDVNFRR